MKLTQIEKAIKMIRLMERRIELLALSIEFNQLANDLTKEIEELRATKTTEEEDGHAFN